ncbi:hypothetical protein PsorP6_008966 [Peronosclerospora sorghi]|uniref:Uncharacterized protein n=1 Tax=Peronosclerospora sorghi TaxID=230839 RepID=A0ACC0W0Z2_9STRA|nr:hypothetical protein PsorP6_008966 [Peronosclerospora sorghi]
MQQLTSFYHLRRALCMALSLINQTRQVVIAASPRAIGGKEEIAGEEPASWWKDTASVEFSRQDVLLLALIALCALRLLVFTVRATYQLLKLPMKWYKALKNKASREFEVVNVDTSLGSSIQQLATIRFCHRQLLSVVEKVKCEMREGQNEDIQQIVASLMCHHKNKKEVTLAEVLTMLHEIKTNDSTLMVSDIEEHLADIKDSVEDEEALDVGILEARAQLQDIYALFIQIRTSIIRRRVQQQQDRYKQQESDCHQRQLSSCNDPTNEISRNLKELTKELPQGFTADMFTSLGNAMHKNVAPSPAVRPEIIPTSDRMRARMARTLSVQELKKQLPGNKQPKIRAGKHSTE